MPDYDASETCSSDFRAAATPASADRPPPKILVTIALDEDVLTWLRSDTQPSNWQKIINDQMRFLMETEIQRDADFDAAMAAIPPEGPS
jgi:uncharacterized protein (DUF4415 family)